MSTALKRLSLAGVSLKKASSHHYAIRLSWAFAAMVSVSPIIQLAQGAVFSSTGAMSVPRFDHTATLLPSGKVLVAGGETRLVGCCPVPTSIAELYDPATGNWTIAGAMTTPRERHTATLLFNGKVLVVGGAGDNPNPTTLLSSAELYDPDRRTWSQTGSLNARREGHTATLLPNGKVLIAGGRGVAGDYIDSLSSSELYDPATETWVTTGAMNTIRNDHTATLLPNGKVLVAGGFGHWNFTLSSSELYDPATGTWTTTGAMTIERGIPTATLLPNGKVLVASGYEFDWTGGHYLPDAELFDPGTETWTATSRLDTAVIGNPAVLLPDGKVLVMGGYSPGGIFLSSVNLHDPATGAWTPTGSMTTPRKNHTATLLNNGKVLVAGGYQDNYIVLPTAELYNSLSNPVADIILTTAARLPSGSFQFVFTNSHGRLFRVLGATDPALPSSNWTTPGCAIELIPGQFQFTDMTTAKIPKRFYRPVSVP